MRRQENAILRESPTWIYMRGLSLGSVAVSIVERNLLLLPAAVTNIDYLSPSGRTEALLATPGKRKPDVLIHCEPHWHFYYNNVHSPYARVVCVRVCNLSLLWLWNFLRLLGKCRKSESGKRCCNFIPKWFVGARKVRAALNLRSFHFGN
jgi:hypothetical protein